MRALFRYFVYGSWWVALCASGMGLLTWFELTGERWNAPIAVFIAGSTLVIYNLNMLTGLRELRTSGTDSERHLWCLANGQLMKLTLAIGLLLSGVSIWFLNHTVWLLMLPLAVVAAAYVFPVLRKNAERIRIRELGLWKIFLISAVWAGMTVILPAVDRYGFGQVGDILSWQLAMERAVFILAITIPFDIRDLANDADKGVRTIPSVLGWKNALLLAEGLMVAFATLLCLRLGMGHPHFIGYLVSVIATMLLIGMANPKRRDMYCSFWLEGTMMLQYSLVVLLS